MRLLLDTRVSLHDPWLVAVVCLGRAGCLVGGWQVAGMGKFPNWGEN